MSELRHLYLILSCWLELLQYLNIICLKCELGDTRKSLFWIFNSVLLIQCFELVTDCDISLGDANQAVCLRSTLVCLMDNHTHKHSLDTRLGLHGLSACVKKCCSCESPGFCTEPFTPLGRALFPLGKSACMNLCDISAKVLPVSKQTSVFGYCTVQCRRSLRKWKLCSSGGQGAQISSPETLHTYLASV